MLSLFGRQRRFCDGFSRRDVLRLGAMGFGGLTLADLLRVESRADTTRKSHQRRSLINIYLPGGPSHLDTFDLKPQAPAEFRGEFRPIETAVPGIAICEHLPRLAAEMDKLAVIRSVSGLNDEHTSNQSDSGWSFNSLREIGGRPSLGSIVSRVQGATNAGAPPFVQLAGESSAGFLGPVYQPFHLDGPGRQNLQLSGVTADRLQNRTELLASLDQLRRETDASGMMDAFDTFTQRALGIVTSSAMANAFDISREDPRVVEQYVNPQGQRYGNNELFLVARRLVEAGVRCVSLWWGGWDTHGDNFNHLRGQLPELDRGLAALISDLAARDMLDEVMILVSGEFGRTPRINGGAGRDHWAPVAFALLAGGGMRTGQAIGTTTRLGEVAQDRPVHIQEIFATLYQRLAIDVEATTLVDPNGRPQYLVDHRRPISELV